MVSRVSIVSGNFGRSLSCVAMAVLVLSAKVLAQDYGSDHKPGVAVGHALVSPHIALSEYAERRGRIAAFVGKGAYALIQGASGDHSSTRFRQSNQFHYLTGVETANAYLLIEGGSGGSILYLPVGLDARTPTDGPMLTAAQAEQAQRITGIEWVRPVDRLAEDIGRRNPAGTVVWTPFFPAEGAGASRAGILRAHADSYSDAWDGRPSREANFIRLLRERFPFLEVRNLSPQLDAMRLIKSPAEQGLMRKASELGMAGLREAMRSTAPGVHEHELDALAGFIFRRHGAQGEAYRAIVASGPNAWFAHHRASPRAMRAGEMVLMDFCPDYAYYRCDITRMWPVSGRFSPEQRELYGFYLDFYEAILYSIEPGLTAQDVRRVALPKIEKRLAERAFSKLHYHESARAFVEAFRHQADDPDMPLGHWIGLSTHDPGWPEDGRFAAGMTLTIEPQFRVPDEQLYFRLEDMILIREDGVEVLSDALPRDIDAIERLMQEAPGLLQSYPALQLP
jgi:Xaa-Pro aminopeptidase